MSQHEVEVRPYGTKNELPEQTARYTSSSRQTEAELNKPPYGQKNEAAGVSVTAQPPQSSYGIGTRADVEVRPLGVTDTTGLNKTVTRTPSRQFNLEQWKNPLLATLLGITLALALLSLSYVPRAISGVWHWGTSWLPGTKNLPTMPETSEGMYQRGKDILQDTYNQRVDQASNLAQNVKETGESFIDRVKHAGESLMPGGGSSGSGPTLTEQARQMACYRAQQAEDMACKGVDMRSFYKSSGGGGMFQQARDTAENVQQQAQGVFEQAKQRASDILEHAKDTVTYPLHAASERFSGSGQTAQSAAEQAQTAAERARQSTYSTLQNAKERMGEAAETAKDTVLGAGQSAKETLQNAGEAVKDTIMGAGQAAKDMVTPGSNKEQAQTVTMNAHGQTRVKVEVQEL